MQPCYYPGEEDLGIGVSSNSRLKIDSGTLQFLSSYTIREAIWYSVELENRSTGWELRIWETYNETRPAQPTTSNNTPLGEARRAILQGLTYHHDYRVDHLKIESLDPVISNLESIVPGVSGVRNTIHLSGATSGATALFFYGLNTGSTPFSSCPSQVLGLSNPVRLGFEVVDSGGFASLDIVVPRRASGQTVYLQALEPWTCVFSDVLEHWFIL